MIAVFLLGVAAILLLHGWYYERNWNRALDVRISFSRPHIFAKESCELTEVIENRKKMPVPIVEIGFRIPQGLQLEDAENTQESDYIYKRDIFAVQGMERITRRYQMTAQKRGCYTVSQLSCHAPSRLFHRTYMMDRMTPEQGSPLFVYAANVNCSLLLRAVEVLLGETECARRLYEDPFVFSSIRPYTIQDPMKSVNWKATARTGALMVNTFASSARICVRILLDVSADPLIPFSDTLRELGISTAASLIRSLLKAQRDAFLLVNCSAESVSPCPQTSHFPQASRTFHNAQPSHFPQTYRTTRFPQASRASHNAQASQESPPSPSHPRSDGLPDYVRFPSCFGAGKMTKVEEFLTTDFDSASLLSYEEMLRREAEQGAGAFAEDEIFVFLTASDRPSLRREIHHLLGSHRSGILAVMSRTADGKREEQEGNLRILPLVTIHGLI